MDVTLLPDTFRFSQGSLQDFADCPRRFLLRRIEGRGYPAPEAEPIRVNELRRERGVRFHEMVCQDHSGVPREEIGASCAGDDALREWWETYKDLDPAGEKGECYPEISVQGHVEGYPVVATYDLVTKGEDGTLHIFDWKTSKRRRSREELTRRLQTKVYPYLLVQAGAFLNGGQAPTPGRIQMTYWFANHPHDPETFEYSSYQCELDGEDLAGQVQEIRAITTRDGFEQTEDDSHCRYCTYRSHCDRGVQAGAVDASGADVLEDMESLEESLDDVEEIAF